MTFRALLALMTLCHISAWFLGSEFLVGATLSPLLIGLGCWMYDFRHFRDFR
jgi:hypothetical protein